MLKKVYNSKKKYNVQSLPNNKVFAFNKDNKLRQKQYIKHKKKYFVKSKVKILKPAPKIKGIKQGYHLNINAYLYKKKQKLYSSKQKQSTLLSLYRYKDRMFKKWLTKHAQNQMFLKIIPKKKHFGILSVYASNRNTILTLSTLNGKVLGRVSSGSTQKASFKKSVRKKTYPANAAGHEMKALCLRKKIYTLVVHVKGIGKGRKAALKAFHANRKKKRVYIYAIENNLGMAHNGCRAPKRRRL